MTLEQFIQFKTDKQTEEIRKIKEEKKEKDWERKHDK